MTAMWTGLAMFLVWTAVGVLPACALVVWTLNVSQSGFVLFLAAVSALAYVALVAFGMTVLVTAWGLG